MTSRPTHSVTDVRTYTGSILTPVGWATEPPFYLDHRRTESVHEGFRKVRTGRGGAQFRLFKSSSRPSPETIEDGEQVRSSRISRDLGNDWVKVTKF